ncbi:hypothetical protein [Actinomycetospora soli]|uniref:hypothetical protein n=1 Tax=Actinomycetospora soli TaxID=2893887 RepID=UPI001E3F8AEB|nr:hypothetical protein [Actinomycetospora soli]MCD2188199.1 hypothetical protein [Actinomycetospora soli]
MRPLLAGLLAGCLLVGCGASVTPSAAVAGVPTAGTLLSAVEHSPAEAAAGVRAAMVELSWARVEPEPGRIDVAALRALRADVDALRRDGRSVSLGLGLHDTPDWVLALPDARLVDASGRTSPYAAIVFDRRLRALAEAYLARVAAVVDLRAVDSIRLGAGGLGEVLYPDGGWWAFDRNARNGPDLPSSMPRNPAPGWVPGSGGLPADGVRAWADWYVGALVDVVRWQMTTLSDLGFGGSFEVLTPGVGVVPAAYDAAVARGLSDDRLGTGAAWAALYAALPHDGRVVASVTSVADGSGGDDPCTPDDRAVALDDPVVGEWSATRWITRVAGEHGLAVTGENPGYGASADLDAAYRDPSEQGMAAVAWRQARACGLRTLSWAHDRQLWDGTLPLAAFADRARG